MASNWLTAARPDLGLHWLNRGISGNRAVDLAGRWQEDCLDLRPDVISILIGVNDCWRRFDANDPTPAEDFEKHYREILEKSARLGARLVLCEPFLLPCPPDRLAWRVDLDPKIAVVRKLACEFAAIYVPFDGIFASACSYQPPEFWAADGVHPSQPGHALMAQAWLRAVGYGAVV